MAIEATITGNLGTTAARRQYQAQRGPAPANGNPTGQPGGGSPWANQPAQGEPPF